jgi:DNA polymerase III delta prime subunit
MTSELTGSGPFSHEAAEHWDLERLYADLTLAKVKAVPHRQPELTEIEKERLCGLLLNHSPASIAEQQYVETKTVEVSFSVGLYRYVEILLGRDRNALESWRDVSHWLAQAGYRRTQVAINWAQMPEVVALYGRQAELQQLERWILDNSRLVAIHGPPGIGKTSLAIELAKKVKPEFEGVIWQSLRHQPSLKSVLNDWIAQLPSTSSSTPSSTLVPLAQSRLGTEGPKSTDGADGAQWYEQLNHLMTYLREHRCLVVIDNLETILSSDSIFGDYAPGYEEYRELFKRLGEEPHQSCVLVTSRESNLETRGSRALTHPIRSLCLEGLSYEAAELILKEQRLVLEPSEEPGKAHWKKLVKQYSGNPYLLRMVASTIHEVFEGKVTRFLKQRMTLFAESIYLIEQQYVRLSAGEKAILQQLAQQDAHVVVETLMTFHPLESINALHRRSLIEKSTAGYTLRPDVMEYMRRELG